MSIKWDDGPQFGRSVSVDPTITIGSDGEIRLNGALCKALGTESKWARLGIDSSGPTLAISLLSSEPVAGGHQLRIRKRSTETAVQQLVIPARLFLLRNKIDFSVTKCFPASLVEGIIMAQLGNGKRSAASPADVDHAYVDQHGQYYYIDVADKPDRFTVWKRDGESVCCMASLLEDKTYPSYAKALAGLDKFAKTQPAWKMCAKKLALKKAEAGSGH